MNKGFTIIESLVAITILIIGVLGPMTAATRGITDGYYAQNQLIATHLAQEALELASVQLKNNYANNAPFLNNIDNCSSGCAVVVKPKSDVSFSFETCSINNNCKMAYNATEGFYRYGAGIGAEFTRTLTVTDLDPGNNTQALLEAKVTWVNKIGSTQKDVTLYRYAINY